MTLEALKSRPRKVLAGMARRNGIVRWHSMTKPELVRALFRLSQIKRPPATRPATRSRVTVVSSRPSRQKVAKRAQKNGHSNGHSNGSVLPLRDRDLCTTEVDDRHVTGRKNYIDATVCDANWIRLQWDLTRDTIRRAEIRLGTDWHTAVPVLRVFEVAADDVNSVSEVRVKDVLIEAGVNTWYVHVPPESRTYRLHIGYRTQVGLFFCSRQIQCLRNARSQCEGRRAGERKSRGQRAFDRKESRDQRCQARRQIREATRLFQPVSFWSGSDRRARTG